MVAVVRVDRAALVVLLVRNLDPAVPAVRHGPWVVGLASGQSAARGAVVG